MDLNNSKPAEALQCPVCLGVLDDPKLLSCRHAICQKCVHKILAAHPTGADAAAGRDDKCVKCPECGRETEVPPDGFAVNYRLVDLVAPELFVDAYACTGCEDQTPIAKLFTCHTCQEALSTTPIWLCALCVVNNHRYDTVAECTKATRQQIAEACESIASSDSLAVMHVGLTMSHLSGAVKERELISQLLNQQNCGSTRFEERVKSADNTLTREDLAASLQDATNLKQKFEQASSFAKDLEGTLQVCRENLEKLFPKEQGNVPVVKEGSGMSRNLFDLSRFEDDQKVIKFTQRRVDAIPDLSRFTELLLLGFRNNLLKSINENLIHTTLIMLDLRNNGITELRGLDALVNLASLDVSFNCLKKIEGLTKLVKLQCMEHYSIEKIEGLETLVNLELLDLSDNRINAIGNLDSQCNLRELYLGKNRIVKLENISHLTKLHSLSISGNLITKLENLDALVELEQLDVREQGIETFDGIQSLNKLKVIAASMNSISSLDHLEHLQQLEHVRLRDNKISQWSEVKKLFKLAKLRAVNLAENPIETQDRDDYRRKLIKVLPQVTQVDDTPCH